MQVVSRTAAHRRRAHGTQAVLEPWGTLIAYTTRMMLFTYPSDRPAGPVLDFASNDVENPALAVTSD
jgi:hypothetical protein